MGEAREKELAKDVGRLEAERDRLRLRVEVLEGEKLALQNCVRAQVAEMRTLRELTLGPAGMMAAVLTTLGKTEVVVSAHTMADTYGTQVVTENSTCDRSFRISIEGKPTKFAPKAVLGEKAAGALVEMEPRR